MNGELVQFTDKEAQKNNRYFANDAEGQALTVVNGKFDGRIGSDLSLTRAFDNALTRTGNKVKAQYFFFANGQNIGTFGQLADAEGHVKANFDVNFSPVSAQFPSSGAVAGRDAVGDTLRCLPRASSATPNLWYVIAEENGLTDPDTPLVAGTQLTIPDKIFALSNAYDSFQPFDAAGLFGMTPTPKALKPSGLAKAVAKIVGYIVQAIVTIYAGEVAGAAAGAAATNYLTQLFARMENGLFDWGAMVEGTAEVLGFRDLYDGSIGDILNPLSDNKVNSFVETRRSMFNMMNGTGAVEFFKNNGDKSSNFEMMWIDPLAMGMRDYPIDYTSVAISAAAAAVGSVVTQGVGNAYVAAALSSVASYGTTVGLNRVAGRDMEWSWRDVATSALSAVASTAASAQVGDLKGLNADAKNFLARAAGGAATLSVTALTGGKVSAADIVTDVFLMPLANSLVAKLTSPTVDVPAVAGSSAPRTGDQASREIADQIDANPLENLVNLGPLTKEERLAGIAAYGGADPTFTIGSEGARGWWGVAQSQLGSGASDSQIQARVLQLMTANPGKTVLHTGDVVNVAAGYSDATPRGVQPHGQCVPIESVCGCLLRRTSGEE